MGGNKGSKNCQGPRFQNRAAQTQANRMTAAGKILTASIERGVDIRRRKKTPLQKATHAANIALGLYKKEEAAFAREKKLCEAELTKNPRTINTYTKDSLPEKGIHKALLTDKHGNSAIFRSNDINDFYALKCKVTLIELNGVKMPALPTHSFH